MTYQTNIHIKEEPRSPASTTDMSHLAAATSVDQHHMAGSVLTYRRPGPPGYDPVSPEPKYSSHVGMGRAVDFGQLNFDPKNSLKEVILSRRRARGEDEMEVKFEEPKHYELTQADIERRERRREQNRRAAKRCRNKKKEIQSYVSKETEKMSHENHLLQQEIVKLKGEVQRLEQIIVCHYTSGCTFKDERVERMLADGMTSHLPQPGLQEAAGASVLEREQLCHEELQYEVSANELTYPEDHVLPVNNLPSWDFVNLNPDPQFAALAGAQDPCTYDPCSTNIPTSFDPTRYDTSTNLPLTSHDEAPPSTLMSCVNPNLVQQQSFAVKLPHTLATTPKLPHIEAMLYHQQTTHAGGMNQMNEYDVSNGSYVSCPYRYLSSEPDQRSEFS
ncbi:uncharacterized protein LOC131957407 [Physella acuta]|uniref:uncharacterized protein LOC131957407 n=1 Tax=Physella acuta TaxID=109671 RepID=UPI0027DCC9CF|nr:uncharacterized protein LOC131957407 [Physella acuta]